MSRDVGRFKSTREATALPALPHLQLATLPGAAATSPSHLLQPAPGEGERPCNGPWRRSTASPPHGS
jgi:hypothetical protein